MIFYSNLLNDFVNTLFSFQDKFNSILIELLNIDILYLEIFIISSIILLSGKAKKALEIGSQIATIIGASIAGYQLYNDNKKSNNNSGSSSNPNNSNSNSSSNTNSSNSDANSKSNNKTNYLYPFFSFKNKNFKFNNKYKYLTILPFLDIVLSENASDLNKFSFSVLALSIVILWTMINILGYLSAVYLLNISNFETKYPKLSIFFKYFRYSSIIYVIIQAFLCLLSTIILIILSFLFIQ